MPSCSSLTRLAATLFVAAAAVVSGCSSSGPGASAPPNELAGLLAQEPDAPVLVPDGVLVTGSTLGTIVRDDNGHVVGLEVWLQVDGDELSEGHRFCFAEVGVLHAADDLGCTTLLNKADGVIVFADLADRGSPLWAANWSRPLP